MIGPGAIGCVVAARLAAAGRVEVAVGARNSIEEIVVDAPEGEIVARPSVVTDPAELGSREWTLLATKAHQTESASAWLRAEGVERVAVLQNGVEHRERVAPFVGDAPIVPVVVDCPSTRHRPGRVTQHAAARFVVPDDEHGRQFAYLFDGSGIVVESIADWTSAAWTKLAENVAGGAITALSGRGLGVIRHADVERVARNLIRECVRVGRAEGANFEDALEDRIVAGMIAADPHRETSMSVDVRLGRPTEVGARNGAVVRAGRRHGIETPANELVTAVLSARRSESDAQAATLRVAKPTADLDSIAAMYREGLGFETLGSFEDHEGFDGVMLGIPGAAYHLEFTHDRAGEAPPRPDPDDHCVFYFEDRGRFEARCDAMDRAGFRTVASHNPYWDRRGRTFEDPEGRRVVLVHGSWPPA